MSSEPMSSREPERELARIRARADLLAALYAHASHDLEQVTRERNSLRSELGHARSEAANELHRVNNELGQAVARARELQQQQAALLGSTSWRVTAPLRALGRLVKRGS